MVCFVDFVSSGLTDTEIGTRRLVAGLQVQRHGKIGSDPQRQSGKRPPKGERCRPEVKLRFFLEADSPVGYGREIGRDGENAGIDLKESQDCSV
jgi:hypothetical protein